MALTLNKIWLLIPIISAATAWLYFLVYFAPSVDGTLKVKLEFPSNLKELQSLAQVLKEYSKTHSLYVLVLFSSAYVYKQTFSIPGSVFLNLLAGALFGVKMGFPLCCVLTAAGASFCYWLSFLVGKEVVEKHYPDKIQYFQNKVEENSHQLVYYLLFLRMFPITPNMLINLISPLIGIPFNMFLVAVFIGLMPYIFLCIQTGEMLASLTSMDDIFSYETLLKMAAIACVALGPSFLMKNPNKVKSKQAINGKDS
uniref:(California timema) hypothetical protein n=1 Tax=Timema californicum TaxID=61474 RepID=A0A7R9J1I3_TIMCA|nr:unnamed protein product [Timema californicum]